MRVDTKSKNIQRKVPCRHSLDFVLHLFCPFLCIYRCHFYELLRDAAFSNRDERLFMTLPQMGTCQNQHYFSFTSNDTFKNLIYFPQKNNIKINWKIKKMKRENKQKRNLNLILVSVLSSVIELWISHGCNF